MDEWTVLKGTYEGRPMLVRINTAVRPLIDGGEHGIRIGVAVPLREPDANGLPGVGEQEALGAFEDRMVELVADRAVLVAVITTGGMREFVLQTGSGAWIPQLHDDLQAALPTHDVQAMAEHDPDWTVYRSLEGT
jgi:hypothetical protein